MKRIIVFILAGLFVGLGVGGFISGSRERDAILEAKAAEKADAAAREHQEEDASATGADTHQGSPDGAEAGHEGQPDSGGGDDQGAEDPGVGDLDSTGSAEAEEPADPPLEEGDTEKLIPETGSVSNPAAGSEAEGPVASPDPVPASSTGNQERLSGPSSARSLAAAALEDGLPPEGPQRLAKIFGAMEPRDAAAVLQNLEDGEVKAILMEMSDRKVADILGEFEPKRAATLSRIVLEIRAGTAR